MPQEAKPRVEGSRLDQLNAKQVRTYLGDGNFGGLYQRSDEEMLAIWKAAVEETRGLLADGWGI